MRRLLVILLCLTLLLAGCAGTATPTTTPTSTPTTPTVEPTTEPTVAPTTEPTVPEPEYDLQVSTNTEFNLPLGQTVRIGDSGLYITFAEVLNDSRCPRGAQCPSAGRVTVRLEFRDDAGTGELEVYHFGLTSHLRGEAWNGHHFEFQVEPHPVLGEELDPNSYYLVLDVSE